LIEKVWKNPENQKPKNRENRENRENSSVLKKFGRKEKKMCIKKML